MTNDEHIRVLCDLAGRPELAEGYIAEGLSPRGVGDRLLARQGFAGINADALYARRAREAVGERAQ